MKSIWLLMVGTWICSVATSGADAEEVRQLISKDGQAISYRLFPVESAKGVFLFIHGIQSHSGWYVESCGQLAESGFQVYFPDRRGSGLHEDQRGHIEDFHTLLDDISAFLDLIHTENPGVPVYLMGVSWGGKLALLYEATHPGEADGLILSTPGIVAKADLSFSDKLRVARISLAGEATAEVEYAPIPLNDPGLFTDDPEWRDWISEDPSTLHNASLQFYRESIQIDAELRKGPIDSKVPILVQLAGRDEIIDNEGLRNYFEKFLTPECRSRLKILEYPKARHTLEFEPNSKEIIGDLLTWVASIAPKSD
ncbi:MAG: alpha/beta fold hydrolase [Candidatus Omnitrophica bacterium]|nr:alpha/beta fold hydrolase [Candidatus Omnitrophota bacterium]